MCIPSIIFIVTDFKHVVDSFVFDSGNITIWTGECDFDESIINHDLRRPKNPIN